MWWVFGGAILLAALAVIVARRAIAVPFAYVVSGAAAAALGAAVWMALPPPPVPAPLRCPAAPTLFEVYFDVNSPVPKWESAVTLADTLQLLRENPSLSAEVRGHADARGTPEHNRDLARSRADAVALWLTGHGIAAGRISVSSAGNTHPAADNNTDEGRAKNRRVELVPVCAHGETATPRGANTPRTTTALRGGI